MPSRWFCLGIVLFWLVVNGWLFCHDLLPRLLPGQTPPYAVELVEEAKTNRAYVNWSLLLDDKVVGRAKTRVEHPRRDFFQLVAEIKPDKVGGVISHRLLRISKIESAYHVDSAGDLLGLSAQVDATVGVLSSRFTFTGEVEGGRLTPRLKLEAPSQLVGKKLTVDLGTVEDPRGGAVLMPLHPVNRLRGLHPGQEWNVYVLDLLAACDGSGGEMSLAHARVGPEEVLFDHGRYRDLPCLVIDYEADHVKVSAWVARKNGLVICQEATRGTTRWTLYRD